MKPVCVVSLLTMLCACHSHPPNDLKSVFQPQYKRDHPVTSKTYYDGADTSSILSKNGVQSYDVLVLNNDSTFALFRSDLDSYSGKWTFVHDSVELSPHPLNKNDIAFQLITSKQQKNTEVIFILSDKAGRPMQNFIIQPFNDHPLYSYNNQGQLVDEKNKKNELPQELEKFYTDSTGAVKINKDAADSLDFTKLYPLTLKHYRISTRNLPDTIKLQIDINGILLESNQINLTGLQGIPKAKVLIYGNRFVFPFD